MRIAFIGAGRLATNLAQALYEAGHEIVQVYSRTKESAETLANLVNARGVDDLCEVTRDAEAYIFAVTDTALPSLIDALGEGREETVFLHTAGSIDMDVFATHVRHYGVIYPMQTFSKERRVDFSRVSFFVEGCDSRSLACAQQLASTLSHKVYTLTSEARRQLHLAAVFACNFSNHCYQLSAELLARENIPFDAMLPLVDETAEKVHHLSPRQAQTGPAVRHDKQVMQAQMALLTDLPLHAAVYELMSRSIIQSQRQDTIIDNP